MSDPTPTLISLVFDPASVAGGATAKCTAQLDVPAPGPKGAAVTLKSDDPHVTPPAKVTIAPGETTSGFDVPTTFVDNRTVAKVTGSYGGSSQDAPLVLMPAVYVTSVTLDPPSLMGSVAAKATIRLSAPAPGNGIVVTLRSSHLSIVAPRTVSVPGGSDEAVATVSTLAVSREIAEYVFAVYGGQSTYDTLTLEPPPVQTVSFASPQVVGGNPTTGTATIPVAAPPEGYTVPLTSADPRVGLPAGASFAAGKTTATFPISTAGVADTLPVVVTAGAAKATLTLTKATLDAFVAPAAWAATQLSATIRLNGMAPPGGTTIAISAPTGPLSPPASVTVPVGQTSATFAVQAPAVTASTAAQLRASLDGVNRDASVRLDPGLTGLTSNPTQISLPDRPPWDDPIVTLGVTLRGPAPDGGAEVALTGHTNPDYYPVQPPPSIVVPAGQTSATTRFKVMGIPYHPYSLTFTASYEGSTA